ncbi:hypothetical protein GCM10023090_01880 [Acidovorax lacteus]|uniref:Uncharacterized protein n=1 Tax=Acidovorax lacteus TaxID=1924988 RepID=A0ABP8KXX6_9BURK
MIHKHEQPKTSQTLRTGIKASERRLARATNAPRNAFEGTKGRENTARGRKKTRNAKQRAGFERR